MKKWYELVYSKNIFKTNSNLEGTLLLRFEMQGRRETALYCKSLQQTMSRHPYSVSKKIYQLNYIQTVAIFPDSVILFLDIYH